MFKKLGLYLNKNLLKFKELGQPPSHFDRYSLLGLSVCPSLCDFTVQASHVFMGSISMKIVD